MHTFSWHVLYLGVSEPLRLCILGRLYVPASEESRQWDENSYFPIWDIELWLRTMWQTQVCVCVCVDCLSFSSSFASQCLISLLLRFLNTTEMVMSINKNKVHFLQILSDLSLLSTKCALFIITLFLNHHEHRATPNITEKKVSQKTKTNTVSFFPISYVYVYMYIYIFSYLDSSQSPARNTIQKKPLTPIEWWFPPFAASTEGYSWNLAFSITQRYL